MSWGEVVRLIDEVPALLELMFRWGGKLFKKSTDKEMKKYRIWYML